MQQTTSAGTVTPAAETHGTDSPASKPAQHAGDITETIAEIYYFSVSSRGDTGQLLFTEMEKAFGTASLQRLFTESIF
jgi:hypothetical protein